MLIDYSPSLSRILYRSSMSEKYENNIDLIFWGVKFLQVGMGFHELSLIEETYNLLKYTRNKYKKEKLSSSDRLYIINPEIENYIVVAHSVIAFENKLDQSTSSIEKLDLEGIEYKKIDFVNK
jgi:hypothetical protein